MTNPDRRRGAFTLALAQLFVGLLLAVPSAAAQSRDSAVVARLLVTTDSLQRLDSTVMRPWCALKATIARRKAACVTIARLHQRLAADVAALLVAPPPAPDTAVVVPDTTPPPVVVTPGAPPGPVLFTHPFAPPANGALLAELPRDTVPVAPPRVTRVIQCTQLQSCYDTAQSGDALELAPGAVHPPVRLGPTARAGWVWIRTHRPQLGGPWERMTATQASALNVATIRSTNGSVEPITVTSGAHHIYLSDVRVTTTAPQSNALVRVGLGESVVSQQPHHVVIARIVADPGPTATLQRCVVADGAYVAVVSSTLTNCKSKGGDAQGVLAIHGAGPLRIEHNTIEASHESIMLGGGDPAIRGLLPSDVVIRRNDLTRPLAWKKTGTAYAPDQWQVKTGVEVKIGKRVLVEGNRICHTWTDGQTGFAVLLKTENQGGGAWGDWSETSDVTVRYNDICGAGGGFNLAPLPAGPGVAMSRVSIYSNVLDSIGVGPYTGPGDAVQLLGVADVVIRDNWIRNVGRSCLYAAAGVQPRLVFTGNTCSGQYGVNRWGGTWDSVAPSNLMTGNTVLPPGTAFGAWPAVPSDSTRDALLRGVVVAP